MRILMSDVHGGYTDAFVAGPHDYEFLPAVGGHGGLSRLGADAPPSTRVVDPDGLRDDPPDVIVLQQPAEAATVTERTGLRPGRDVPALFLEHNTPRTSIPGTRHPMAEAGLRIVHVTGLNALLWDSGSAPTTVIEHGLVDPGLRYEGSLPHAAFVVNEPVRRWRVTGTDLLTRFAPAPVDAFGIDADRLPAALDHQPGVSYAGNLSPTELREALAVRRLYLHLNRWTSLGLSLIESMLLGLPVVVLDSTVAARTVPPAAGAISADPDELVGAVHRLLADPDAARAAGLVAREAALERHGHARFLADWDRVLVAVASG